MKREAESALASVMKPMKREDVTDLIVFRKMKSGLKWPEIAKKVGAVQGMDRPPPASARCR